MSILRLFCSWTIALRLVCGANITGDGTRKQGDVEISNFPISLRDGLVIDVSFVCEFKGSIRAPGGWDNSVRHSNDVLQARANVKNNKHKDVYGLAQGVCTCHRRYV